MIDYRREDYMENTTWIYILVIIVVLSAILKFTNVLSYTILKNKVLKSRKWDLNICCGKTDGGGINADIVKHTETNKFLLLESIYDIPLENASLDYVFSSHTIEHIDDPKDFYRELERVGKHITILVPPLWDITAAFNFLEHKWIFLTFKTRHTKLPKFIKLPLSGWYQRKFGQKIKA